MTENESIIKQTYYNENLNYFFEVYNHIALEMFSYLLKETNDYINAFCDNDKEIQKYYLNKYSKSKKQLKKSLLNSFDFDCKLTFNFDFYDSGLILNKPSFEKFASKYLTIPDYEYLTEVDNDEINEYLKNFDLAKDFKNEIEKIKIETNLDIIDDILPMFLDFSYYKHLLKDQKELEKNNLKINGLPEIDLIQRSEVLYNKDYEKYFAPYGFELFEYINDKWKNDFLFTKYSEIYHFLYSPYGKNGFLKCSQVKYRFFLENYLKIKISKVNQRSNDNNLKEYLNGLRSDFKNQTNAPI